MDQLTISTPAAPAVAPAPVTPAAERPAWLPEKFKTPDELVKSYKELESKLGSKATDAAPAPTTEAPKTEATPATPAVTQPALAKYEQEFAQTGALSEASIAELAKIGISKDTVDNYIRGQQAAAAASANEVYSVVGGEQQFKQVLGWAEKNLSPDEKSAYNKAVQSNDMAAVKLAVAGMHAKFTTAYGTTPNLLGGRASANTGPVPFANWAQVTAAMSDKRYAVDSAYRQEVEARMSNSKL